MINRTTIKTIDEIEGCIEKKNITMDRDIESIVRGIIAGVREEGDEAVNRYTRQFDGVELNKNFKVTEKEIEEAYEATDAKLLRALEVAKNNIYDFHREQLPTNISITTKNNSNLGFIYRPLRRVGVYVPGGLGAYPSTVLMNVIPAKIAGVREIAIFTPPSMDGKLPKSIAACAKLLGINELYKVGGAQAIAAGAFGTQTIERVDKLVGPGNAYVACAKKEIYGYAAIDTITGPSEILIIADETANPVYAALDLLSQLEHDKMAKAYLITTSMEFADRVEEELITFVEGLNRKNVIKEALKNSYIFAVEDIEMAILAANLIAPEHLELLGDRTVDYVDKFENAGAIFVGNYSPEPIGDYIAGTNHVLPTDGSARFSSGLSVMDFMKHISFVKYSRKDFNTYAPFAIEIANNEGLTAHANAMLQRLIKE